MNYDPTIRGWRFKDPTDETDIFIFYIDGSIAFPQAGTYARIRFAPDGSGLEVTDPSRNWRKIPFAFGDDVSALALTGDTPPTFPTSKTLSKYLGVTETQTPITAPIDGQILKKDSPF